MLPATIHIALAVCLCLWLWTLRNSFGAWTREARIITAIGVLIRAFASEFLFFVSYFHLPFARTLQSGRGFWFFAIDAPFYLRFADDIFRSGPLGMLIVKDTYPSRTFLQILSVFVGAFGRYASIGIPLNCLAFLGSCSAVVWIAARIHARPFAVITCLTALALGPSSILWTLQPLKDPVFVLFLMLAMILCLQWQSIWQSVPGSGHFTRAVITCSLTLIVLIWAIAGLRWYFAAMIWLAFAVFGFLIWLKTPRRWKNAIVTVVMFLALSQAVRIGSSTDFPSFAAHLFDLTPKAVEHWRPSTIRRVLGEMRHGFDTTPGGTMITSGPTLTTRTAVTASAPATAVARVATNHPAADHVNAPDIAHAHVAHAPPPVAAAHAATAAPIAKAHAPAPHVVVPPAVAPVVAPVAAPVVAPVVAPVAAPAPQVVPDADTEQRFSAGLLSGSVATFLPRFISQRLGLIRIGGGRGFWFFADLDTLIFDAVLLCSFAWCLNALRRKRAALTPLSVFVALVLVLAAVPMIYTVTNFGTLFRLRGMLYALAAVLPVTMRSTESAESEGRPVTG